MEKYKYSDQASLQDILSCLCMIEILGRFEDRYAWSDKGREPSNCQGSHEIKLWPLKASQVRSSTGWSNLLRKRT